ncbi:MAG: DUF4239 domain-containing protein [Cyanobacteria bacterium SZAS LIN-2]|nr:DUF4239 domain-containing protein [Cyanobacteria bacterium SZAS LIN-2]MBS2006077.1 DUF4239 domain-containing protein [Cyanobacteria bacterium SZAS TMP-1]
MIETWAFSTALVGGAVIFSILGLLLVRKKVAGSSLRRHHEVAGYLLSVVGTLYSVLLGLIVVDTQAKYQEAKEMARQEADAALDLFHMAYTMPMPARAKLHHQLQKYMDCVIHEEWNGPTPDGGFNESAAQVFHEIWWTLTDYEPATDKQQTCLQKILDLQQTMTDSRRYRLQMSKTGMPAVLWAVLIAGGILTVVFTYLFEVEEQKSHIIMTALVVLALSLNFLLVALFSNPYKGHMRLPATPFEYDQRVMLNLLKERPDPGTSQ